MYRKILIVLLGIFVSYQMWAQDFGFGFGFGDDAATSGNSGNALSVSIGGEVEAELLAYIDDFSQGAEGFSFGDIFFGRLNFAAGISIADAFINLKLEPSATPISIDEAYVRAYFGNFEVEGGLRKLTWGKADSFGVLDVINPLDYSALTDLSDLMNFKIARPLVRLSYRIGSFSKLEGVFVPHFEPMRFAEEGRWVPSQMKQLGKANLLRQLKPFKQMIESYFNIDDLNEDNFVINLKSDDTTKINYAQGGLRFTTTIGSADIGAQYYYGRLTRPVYSVDFMLPQPTDPIIPVGVHFSYNPYHQIGIDWAQVLFGFNIRAEFAANITEDLEGDDPTVYNPNLAWSFGFDRNLFWGINLSLQANQTIRLMHEKISNKKMSFPVSVAGFNFNFETDFYSDIEANTDVTATQIIAVIRKSFLRDQLEFQTAVFWEVEDKDFMIVPSLVWTKDAVSIELSGGIFTGNEDGQFGQYWKNSFVKVVLGYSF